MKAEIRALRGPNVWSRQTVVEVVLCCDPAELSMDPAAFQGALQRQCPQFAALAVPDDAGPAYAAHAVAAIALQLQALADSQVSFSRVCSGNEEGLYRIVVEYREEEVGRRAMEHAVALFAAVLSGGSFALGPCIDALRELNEDVRLGPSTGSIVNAALRRDIPYRRLTQGSLVQFGWGRKQRRIQAAETDLSSAISESIAQDKQLTKMLIATAGVPVPRGRGVHSAEDACAAAIDIGGPVVVKPRDGNQGKGVTVNIKGREQVEAAYRLAAEHGSGVIVERYVAGRDFRLLVVGDALVAAARRDPPHVVGDGEHTVAELVAIVNRDPRRGEGHATALTKIRLDETAIATMAAQGYGADSVPPKGVQVTLRNNANLSTGGTATDVTDEVHPEVAAMAVAAAQMVGLDVCGIDLVSQNIHQPLDEQIGCVVEINAAPGLRMHLAPSFGKSRDVGEAIVNNMFADDEAGRIPVVAVAGTNGKTTTVRLIAHLIGQTGAHVGMTNSDGVYIGSKRIDTGDCSGPRSARNVLLHPLVDAAVFETARGGILREGLGFDRCDVAVVTNIGMGDHLGLNFIDTVDQLARVKRVVVENVSPDGTAVLNAEDPQVSAMAAYCPGDVVFFARDAAHPILKEHRESGRRAVWVEGGAIVAGQNGFQHRLPLGRIPLTRGGTIGFQVQNAMAAVAAAWALGLDWGLIEQGLAGFVNDATTAPGRFNVYDYRGATVIADYGHNPDAIEALVEAVETIPASRRSVVISGAGDRRDIDLRRQTEILGAAFDEVVLYQDMCQRGREDGEVLALLRSGLSGAPRAKSVREIRGEFVAIDTALDALRPGELCLVLIDQVEEALEHIGRRVMASDAIIA